MFLIILSMFTLTFTLNLFLRFFLRYNIISRNYYILKTLITIFVIFQYHNNKPLIFQSELLKNFMYYHKKIRNMRLSKLNRLSTYFYTIQQTKHELVRKNFDKRCTPEHRILHPIHFT